MSSTALQFADVALVPFPFTDQSSSKQRPAVIVSNATYHQERRDVILMPVTSQLHGGALGFGEVLVQDWEAAGLLKPSLIKPVLATLEYSLVIRILGRLSGRDMEALRENMPRILG